jgi:putative aminopeptidase FrvX
VAAADPVAVLARLAAPPSAPFHEQRVAREIVALCAAAGLPWEADRYGNLLVWHRGAATAGAATAGGRRPIAFGAHTDHPGLEVVQTAPLLGRLLGGVPRHAFDRPVPVRFVHGEHGPEETPGRITGQREGADGRVELLLEAGGPVPAGSFGVFDVGPFREAGGLLHLPAADDLAGCAAILSALVRCARMGLPADVCGVFTRCEEVGLVGATLVARQGLLPPQTLVVSLEASRELPGAVIGGGPVIRVGDATMAFHPDVEAVLRRARARLLEEDAAQESGQGEARARPVQRQLMSGGTCEAVAYALAGYAAGGVAFPLGNYHNVGPDGVIAAEYIHRRDLETGTDLLVAAAGCVAEGERAEPAAARLAQRADAAASRLEASAGGWSLV